MTQLLTDNEISTVVHDIDCGEVRPFDIEFARAIESAVLAKLREQEPVAVVVDSDSLESVISPAVAVGSELYLHPAPTPEGWISVNDRLPKVGRTPILVAVSWVKYGEHEDGTPTEATGVDVTEGEYIPAHGEAGGYFDSYQGRHGDIQYITHWMPLPAPPMAAAGSD